MTSKTPLFRARQTYRVGYHAYRISYSYLDMGDSVRRVINPVVYSNTCDIDKIEDWWYKYWSHNDDMPELLSISYLGVVEGVKYNRLILNKPNDVGEVDDR